MAGSLRNQGMMVVLSSPSGAGKSSLSRSLVARDSNLHLSISATTRPMRSGEIDGTDYHFISHNDFKNKISTNAFLEHAHVFGNDYGTLITDVDSYLQESIDVVFDIDWQGAQTIRKNAPDNSVFIYILPPSLEVLRSRLEKRKQDSLLTIENRMAEAKNEISHYHEYDYIVVNDDFETALSNIESIIKAERLKRTRLALVDDFVMGLVG